MATIISEQPAESDLRATPVVFDFPVTFEGRTYAEVQLVEARVSDQLAVDLPGQSLGQFEARLIARLANMPFEALLLLRTCDYGKLSRAFADFSFGPKGK